MHQKQVLDHGVVILRNLAGPTRRIGYDKNENPLGDARLFDADDIDPAQAARMSFDQMDSNRTYEEDMKLAKYLLVNGHTSPFEMVQVWLEVKVPIFVDRQLVRHRVWRRNEESARYIVLADKFYIPKAGDVGIRPPNMKQGRIRPAWEDISKEQQTNILAWLAKLETDCRDSYLRYQQAIDILGIPPELARLQLHLNHYVHWLGNVDLSNLFKFLALRDHNHAQFEAQQYAKAIIELLRPHLPGLMALYDEVIKK